MLGKRVSRQDFSTARRNVRQDVGETGFELMLGNEEGALGEEEPSWSCGGRRDDPTDGRNDFIPRMSDVSVLWKFEGTRSEHASGARSEVLSLLREF